jgi:carbamoyltransferase
MNLVGFGLTAHDSSVAAYKNGKFLYRKAERQFKSKHAYADKAWAETVLKEWGIEKYESMESTFLTGGNPHKTKEDNRLDHHYTHLLSSSVYRDTHLVLDSLATGPSANGRNMSPYTGMIKVGNRQTQRLLETSVPELLNTCVYSTDLKENPDNFGFKENEIFSFVEELMKKGKHPEFHRLVETIDLPGKVMGLQSYGKINHSKLKEWLSINQYRNNIARKDMINSVFNHNHIATIHKFCEEITLEKAKLIPNCFTYSGGVAQNVVINRAMLDAGLDVHIDPWAYDGGCSIGALHYLLDKHDIERPFNWEQDDEAPSGEPDGPLYKQVAELLAQNKVVGWYQGKGEVGPRALGNRSILFNPTHKDNKDRINKIKNREWWRPFGASVKEDQADRFFDLPVSRHMLFNSNVKYSGIPAVTHVDGTCRHQTVPETNHQYYWMLEAFEQETGLPVLGNTSLNKQGKPICSTVEEALDIFKTSELDAICIGDTLYEN